MFPIAARQPVCEEGRDVERVAPVSAILVTGPALFALRTRSGENSGWLLWAATIVGSSASLGGLLLGCVALVTVKRGELRSGRRRAVAGIIANAVLTSLIVITAITARTVNAEAARVREAAALQDSEMRFNTIMADLRIRQKRMGRLAETGQGDVALIAQTASKLLQRQYVVMENCYAAFGPVKNGHLLNMAQVEQQDELTRRMESVKKFAAAYNQLQEFSTNIDQVYRDELQKSGVSISHLDVELETFHKNMYAVNSWLNQIAAANSHWAEGELAALDLLSTNWGKWTYDQDARKLEFQDESQAHAFNQLVRQINDSRRMADQAKQKMLKLQ